MNIYKIIFLILLVSVILMIFPSILIKIKHIKRLNSKKKPFKHGSSNAKNVKVNKNENHVYVINRCKVNYSKEDREIMSRIFNQNRTVSINSSSKHFTDSVKTKKENSIQFNNVSTNFTNNKSGTDVALDIALGVAVISASQQVSNLPSTTSPDCGQNVDASLDCGVF
ncbi:hypothetical protein HB665_15330 [Bacillus paranthracis]|uniref:hypothetical protein n=1 Tax=Bacillus cereus group TaxID=86661 RepID=UPI0014441CD1|nr:hypothetical protein [Bacillus paranthracis]NKX25538.1 hypothetical protein [Bacillus paranthracis]